MTGRIEGLLPGGVRPRQLLVRTLLLGMLLCQADGRPAHLTRVHQALLGLPEPQQRRLGVITTWRGGPHRLTYRQVEYTFSLVVGVLGRDAPDGAPSRELSDVVDALVEASVPAAYKEASSAVAVDWSDHESFAAPPTRTGSPGADPQAAWGHRRGGPHKGELFFGYYLQAVTMVAGETGPDVPELIRRTLLTSCTLDPPTALVGVLRRLVGSGVALGDVLCDSGYAHRTAQHWALPVRTLGAQLVMDLHPHDRGVRGTYGGAICANGSLFCPATPKALLELGPLARGAGPEEIAEHDRRSSELARYKLGRITTDDKDGFHRVMCPAAMSKIRCPARPTSLSLAFDKPQVLAPPEHPPACCSQATLTVPPEVNAKTRQKHDYPSKAHRVSFARRTSVERAYATLKDPASTDVTRGWCRVMGLCAISLLLTTAVVVRNVRIVDAFEARQRETFERSQRGLAPKTRRRRRKTIENLIASSAAG